MSGILIPGQKDKPESGGGIELPKGYSSSKPAPAESKPAPERQQPSPAQGGRSASENSPAIGTARATECRRTAHGTGSRVGSRQTAR